MNGEAAGRAAPASTVGHWYFAYGSNMNPARVTQRGLHYHQVLGGTMAGVGLRFNKQAKDHPDCGHANLVYAPAEHSEGVLYELVDATMIARMDRFERTPVNYSRELIRVQSVLGTIQAWTYFANPAVIRGGLLPSRDYLNHLLAGQAFLSEAYYRKLQQQAVSDESHGK